MHAYLRGDFEAAYRGFADSIDAGIGSPSASLLAGVSLFQLGRIPEAIPFLEAVVASEHEAPDDLMTRYAPPDRVRHQLEIAIVEGIYASLDVDSLAAALLLAEAYQAIGNRTEAIELMNGLTELDPNDDAIRLSLCDLLFEAADFARLVAVASAASPSTNLGFACHIFKSQGESWLGDWPAAMATLESALADTESDDETALRVAHESLLQVYDELGIPRTRWRDFQHVLRRRKGESDDRRVARRKSYESRAFGPGQSADE